MEYMLDPPMVDSWRRTRLEVYTAPSPHELKWLIALLKKKKKLCHELHFDLIFLMKVRRQLELFFKFSHMKEIQVGIASHSDYQFCENSCGRQEINTCSCEVDIPYHFDHLSIRLPKEWLIIQRITNRKIAYFL